MIIDVHGHFVATEVLERLRREGGTYGITVLDGPAGPCLRIGDEPPTPPFFPDLHDLQRRQEHLRRTEVDLQILSPWLEMVGYTLPPPQGQRWSRLLNDTLAREAAALASASCYATMATVPLQDARLAAAELEYAVTHLGYTGATLATHVAGRNLGEAGLDVFWQAAQALRAPIIIHPIHIHAHELPRVQSYYLFNLASNPFETTVAATSLIFSGVVERFPDLAIILVHGGGFLPYQIGRFQQGYATRHDLLGAQNSRLPQDCLRWFYYDTVLYSPAALRFMVEQVTSRQVVLGSDYPFPIGDFDPVRSVREAQLGSEATQAILGENAQTLFRLR
jgi:aminocarboxymuconate-semialdehyde decarboxylase